MREIELQLAKDALATLRAGELEMLEEKLKDHVESAEKRLETAKAL